MSTESLSATTIQPARILTAPMTRKRRALRAFLSNTLTRFGVAVLAVLVLLALIPPGLLPHDPRAGELTLRFQPGVWSPEGSWTYPLGTDNLGRDIVSRMMYGGRYSLLITFSSVPIAMLVGALLGTVAGYYGGRLESVIMRVVDIQLAFPTVLLMIAIVAVLGPSVASVIGVLAFAGWVRYARVVRGSVLSLREREFVEAARALGAGNGRILRHHVVPNAFSPIVVLATFEMARMLLLESTLSFLGVGIQPPEASWGSMIADGRNYLSDAWWVSLTPGAAITLAVLSFNFVGDGLRDALDPRLNVD